VNKSVFDLLSQANPDVEIVTCKYCGHTTTSDQERCPHCQRFLKLPTLAQYGKKLPIGIVADGKLMKPFDVRKVNFDVEMQISESWKRFAQMARRDQLTSLQHCLTVLAHTIVDLGGKQFQDLPFAQRMAILKRMYDGDPWYMYAWTRIETLGENLELLNLECLNCGQKIASCDVDVTTLEVATLDSIQELTKVITLEDGFTFLGREKCKKLKIQPTTISSVLNASSLSQAAQKAEQIYEAVVEVEDFGDKSLLTKTDLATMTKRDLDFLSRQIDRHTGGPDWRVEIDGCVCGQSFNVLLPARYEDFFSPSFRYDLGRIF